MPNVFYRLRVTKKRIQMTFLSEKTWNFGFQHSKVHPNGLFLKNTQKPAQETVISRRTNSFFRQFTQFSPCMSFVALLKIIFILHSTMIGLKRNQLGCQIFVKNCWWRESNPELLGHEVMGPTWWPKSLCLCWKCSKEISTPTTYSPNFESG